MPVLQRQSRVLIGANSTSLPEFLPTHHCEAAGDPIEAAKHLQRAAWWVGKTNSAEALKHWKRVRSLLQYQPPSKLIDELRQVASGQILGVGWREGMTAEEAKPFADEALRYARGGAKKQVPILLGGYGRILASSGAADDYVALAREALTVSAEENDAGRIATVNGMLSQAFYLAGMLKDALAANDAALRAITSRHDPDDTVVLGLTVDKILGFDVAHWIKCMRTRILVGLGRYTEAKEWLEKLLAVDDAAVAPVVQFIPHFASVEMARQLGEPESAQLHADQVVAYAKQHAIPYLHVVALASRGVAKFAAADYAASAALFLEGLEYARQTRAGLEFESRLLAELAHAHLCDGKHQLAADVADAAIEVARRRTHRVPECHACLVLAATLGRHDDPRCHQESQAFLSRAEHLIELSGVGFFGALHAQAKSGIGISRH
jgi:tetratricopeptide (TPR) repeat protein